MLFSNCILLEETRICVQQKIATLNFSLIITDPNGLESEESTVLVTITADSVPIANAGNDFRSHANNTVVLDGSASFDNTPIADLSYQWVATSTLPFYDEETCDVYNGEWENSLCVVTIINADDVNAEFTAPDVEHGNQIVLSFELTVSDGKKNTSILKLKEQYNNAKQDIQDYQFQYDRILTQIKNASSNSEIGPIQDDLKVINDYINSLKQG